DDLPVAASRSDSGTIEIAAESTDLEPRFTDEEEGGGPRHFRGADVVDRPDRRRLVTLLVAVPVLLFLVLLLGWAVDSAALSGQVMRNVEMSGRPVGGLGEASLPDVVGDVAHDLEARPVAIRSGENTYETTAAEIGLTVDRDATVEAALDAGRSDPLLVRPFKWLGSFFSTRQVPVEYTVDEATVGLKLFELQGGTIQPAHDPTIQLTDQGFTVVPGTNGSGIDAHAVADDLPVAASRSDSGTIEIAAESTDLEPRFTDEEAQELADRANEMTADGITLKAADTEVRVEPAQLRSWLDPVPRDDELTLAINGQRVTEALPQVFAGLSHEPVNATFTLEGGRPRVVPSRPGVACCGDDSADRVWQALDAGEPVATLETTEVEPEITTDEANSWGIVEPIGGNHAWQNGAATTAGPGFTTYHAAGEPRVTNIHRIADLVRGAVIPPGEEFSINDYVGERTVAKGFVEAGAIRDGVHVPEVGGGVSQFATTTFNAAFFAGLDIDEYQAHTEYFSRYPPGREATMGYPYPDLRFTNDTPYGILIWTSYTDTSLTVTFYSTHYWDADQTAISEGMSDLCRVVTTTRTRSAPDHPADTDQFQATYRPAEGIGCQGQPTAPIPPDAAG
ncbi:MAG TPA: VanW family protein, partial [Acidimicrobiales bacterium]